MDRDDRPESDKATMDFCSGSANSKAWRDVWGAGQGVGQMSDAPPAAVIVERLEAEYALARLRLGRN